MRDPVNVSDLQTPSDVVNGIPYYRLLIKIFN